MLRAPCIVIALSLVVFALDEAACFGPGAPSEAPPARAVTGASLGPSTVTLANDADAGAIAYVAFGPDSQLTSADACGSDAGTCSFSLPPKSVLELPVLGRYANLTVSFDEPVTCGSTKAEVNVNNPAWYDVVDVSLVDGFNRAVTLAVIDGAGDHALHVSSPSGNEAAFGVYPLGCDVCVARQRPPCPQTPGPGTRAGCKAGTQDKPQVPCQYQGPTLHGGSRVFVRAG